MLPYVDRLMNPAIGLKDEKAGILHELIAAGHKEEIVRKNLIKPYHKKKKKIRHHVLSGAGKMRGATYILTLAQLQLRCVEIKVGVKIFKELSDGILVGFLLQDSHEVVKLIPAALVCDDSRREIPQDVRTRCLDSIQIPVSEVSSDTYTCELRARGVYFSCKNISTIPLRPLGWLKKTKRLQWMSQVRCCNCTNGDGKVCQ